MGFKKRTITTGELGGVPVLPRDSRSLLRRFVDWAAVQRKAVEADLRGRLGIAEGEPRPVTTLVFDVRDPDFFPIVGLQCGGRTADTFPNAPRLEATSA